MAEDLDLNRVINDPAYRRQVISRLNDEAAKERQTVAADAAADGATPPSGARSISDPPPLR